MKCTSDCSNKDCHRHKDKRQADIKVTDIFLNTDIDFNKDLSCPDFIIKEEVENV